MSTPMPPHGQPSISPARRMSTGAKIALGCGGVAALGVIGLVLLVVIAVALGDAERAEEAAAAPAVESPAPAVTEDDALDAAGLVEELAEVYPLPDPRDTTDGCQNDHANDCVARVTTDLMSVTELEGEEQAAEWVETMGEVADARQVGRFMLLWHEDSLQAAEARDELEERAQELVGG